MGLTIPVLIVLAAFALFVGCYSSYKGGLLDEVMRILCDILMAFPHCHRDFYAGVVSADGTLLCKD